MPGQSLRLCGHPIQVASCGSHSAGKRYPTAAGEIPPFGPSKAPSFPRKQESNPFRTDADPRLRGGDDTGRVSSLWVGDIWLCFLTRSVCRD